MRATTDTGDARTALGRRMEQAAREAHLNGKQVAAEMRNVDSYVTVYRWWRGERSPRGDVLAEYARVVGKPVEWFYRSGDEAMNKELMQLWLKTADAVMAGRSVSAAMAELGVAMSDEERRMLAERSASIRQAIMGFAGGNWDVLTDEEKAGVLLQIAELAEAHRRDEPAGE